MFENSALEQEDNDGPIRSFSDSFALISYSCCINLGIDKLSKPLKMVESKKVNEMLLMQP